MHPTLIKANIALFTGDRTETLRLLTEYRSQHPDHHNDPQVLWMYAHTHVNQEDCIQALRELVSVTDPNNRYSRMAQDYLALESDYQQKLAPSALPRLTPVTVWRAVVVLLLCGVIGVLLARSPQNTLPSIAATSTPSVEITATIPPDRSEALVADTYTTRYDAGFLQVAAFEDQSQRVVDVNGQPVKPVLGARFYAIRIVFECRAGICDNPPQAELAIQMDNGNIIPARRDLRIITEEQLQPIALGRVTRGWVVFEIPTISGIASLRITPGVSNNATPVVQTIQLPAP